MEKKYLNYKVAEKVATLFGLGYVKIAPGTWGSIATLPIWFGILFIMRHTIIWSHLWLYFGIWSLILCGFALLGYYSVDSYCHHNKTHDAGEIIVDEVIGQLIAFIMPFKVSVIYLYYQPEIMVNLEKTPSLILFLFIIFIMPIVFFRIFDIKKPSFIGKIDRGMNDSLGVIMDDIFAGLLGGICSSILILIVLTIW